MSSSARDALVQQIHLAFAGVTLGKGISLRQAEVIDTFAKGVTPAEFARLPLSEETQYWDRISLAELERDNVAHLDPEGFRFYLPALMISVMDHYDPTSMRVIGTLSALYPEDKLAAYHLPRYDLLTLEQKQAVVIFLGAIGQLVVLDEEDATVVNRALRYWEQFIPRSP